MSMMMAAHFSTDRIRFHFDGLHIDTGTGRLKKIVLEGKPLIVKAANFYSEQYIHICFMKNSSASRYVTSASRYQSRSSIYI